MIIGAGIVPHGSLILEHSDFSLFPGAKNLFQAMKSLSKIIEKQNPEIIFMITPHGIQLSNSFGIYLNESGNGSAEWNNKYQNYTVQINISSKFSHKLFEYLKDNQVEIESIIAFSEKKSISLKWGETVPLWFLKNLNTEYVIFTIPSRRYDNPKNMIPELQQLGDQLFNYLNNSAKKIYFLVSGDLSHTHKENGPYNFSNKANEFDILIEEWILKQKKELLLNKAANIVNEALSCGFTGFVLMQSLLEKMKMKSTILSREIPDYYGMIVAHYFR